MTTETEATKIADSAGHVPSDSANNSTGTSATGTGESGSELPATTAAKQPSPPSRDPGTVKEALSGPDADQWRQAIHDEFAAMQANDVYEAVPRSMLPKATRLLRSMVIFKKKIDDKGRVTKYKARWVAKGYSQTKGVNYQETFAPTATATAIRTMLAMAVARGMGIQQMDVNTAFLNAPIDHEIYVEPPRGADIVAPGSVLRLKRGLYGLKQSPRLWNQTLDEWMRSQGFTATATDACIYTRRSAAGALVWVAVYVDDLLIMADSDKDMAAFKNAISTRFKMKDLGEPDLCLGIKVRHDKAGGTVTLSQEHYLRALLDDFGMADCKPLGTPLDTGYVDEPADKDQPLPDVDYRGLIGSLLYASTMTRPDISTAVSMLSRHMQRFSMKHWTAAKHLLRYIKGTLHYNVVYSGKQDNAGTLVAYADASFGSDIATRRSRTGYVVLCSGGPVSWNSKLQPTVATASADAEYMALSSVAHELMFLRQLQQELLHEPLDAATTVHCDNQPAIAVARRCTTRMRHIDIRHHYVRELVDHGQIELAFIPTAEMVADLLTKILPKPRTLQFSAALLGNTTPSGLTRGTAHAAVLRGPASVGQPPQTTKCLTPGPARHALPVRAQGH